MTAKQERVFGNREGIILCLYFCFTFSLNQHKINRGDNWRAFKLACDQEDLPPAPSSSSPDVAALGLWEKPAQHQPKLGKTFAHIFSQSP